MRPLLDLDPDEQRRRFASARLLATDVDGTLTQAAKLSPAIVQAIAALCAAGVEVMPVSGRPAGELQGLVRYLPGVRRAIAENGLLEIVPDHPPRWLAAKSDRARLRTLARELSDALALDLQPTADDPFRLGDVAFEREARSDAILAELGQRARERGVHVTWSNVHVHFTEEPPDKGVGLLAAAECDPSAIITIGDAPNDAGLFVAGRFGTTVGTADVLRHEAAMPALPELVASAPEAAGFLELATLVLAHR
ncbi:MAG TPA: HAD hydrolase family protein [Nannocystaceae bacterium]|nr:HAD hydrolase family protein [Nannocystaceae bacterium]